MAITVEEFAANMIRILSERYSQLYLLNGNMISALQMSLVSTSVSQEFPKMLYKRMLGGEDLTRIVEDRTEQQAAEDDGFLTTPSPRPSGYPEQWCEIEPREAATIAES